uniref:Glucose-methanol-choline oxidoreductase N-terminal domain-containing protein n=1 Tax=Heliothis virescens TaxID=7102 RepID=A0A2A4K6C3_HELVI
MVAAEVIAALKSRQAAFLIIRLLELTGYLYPPPAKLKNGDNYDYIIVGGGAAGSVIATRLAQQKYNVLLLEAGQDAPYESTYPSLMSYLKHTKSDWNYTSENDKHSYQCHPDKNAQITVGKMLGGSSALNHMVYSRGHPQNYEDWYWITNDTNWKWKNVLPYFIKSEAIHDSGILNSTQSECFFGTEGYIGVTRNENPFTDQFLQGFEQVGKHLINIIDGSELGYSRGLLTIYDQRRQDAGSQYLQHVTDSKYLAVAKGTLATRIKFDKNRTATGVEVITEENETIVINARQEIIVTAGAIKSPQLLMLSGLGPKNDIRKFGIPLIADLPVGNNFLDHIGVFIPHKTNKTLVKVETDPSKYPTGLFVGYAALNETRAQHLTFPDYEAMGLVFNNLDYLVQFCVSDNNFSDAPCNKLYDEANGNQVLVTLISSLYTESRGQVQLRSTNPRDPPKIFTGAFSDDRDLDDFVKYVNDYLIVENSAAFKALGASMVDLTKPKCDGFKKGSREYWRCYILCMMVSLQHYGGTCAMGSVVDSRLRVYGVNKLRVADASVMPTLVTGNINAAVVMIAERAAALIIEDAGAYNDVEHEQIKQDQIKNLP